MPALVLSPAARWLIGVLIVLAMCGASFHYGIQWQEGVQAQDDLKQADETRARMLDRMKRDREFSASLASALAAERAGRNQDQRDFDKRLFDAPRETLVETSCPQQGEPNRNAAGREEAASPPAAQGISEPASSGEAGAKDVARPSARLSAIGCRLWNDALFAGFTAAERGQLPPGADACAGPVEFDDALRNLRANATLLGECRLREQKTQGKLRDLLQGKGG